MPVVIGAVGPWIERDYGRRPWVIHAVEQAQLDARAMLGKHAEIGAAIAERGAERKAAASGNGVVHLFPLHPLQGGGHIGNEQRVVLKNWIARYERGGMLIRFEAGMNEIEHR